MRNISVKLIWIWPLVNEKMSFTYIYNLSLAAILFSEVEGFVQFW